VHYQRLLALGGAPPGLGHLSSSSTNSRYWSDVVGGPTAALADLAAAAWQDDVSGLVNQHRGRAPLTAASW
jgi:hypothetical protein